MTTQIGLFAQPMCGILTTLTSDFTKKVKESAQLLQ